MAFALDRLLAEQEDENVAVPQTRTLAVEVLNGRLGPTVAIGTA